MIRLFRAVGMYLLLLLIGAFCFAIVYVMAYGVYSR
jgi:hypothetical protein